MAKPQSTENLVKQYLNICNDILIKQRDTVPFEEIIALINRIIDNEKTITLKVVDDQGKTLGLYATTFMVDEFKPIGVHSPNQETQFVVSRRYLEHVVDNADDYMAHPIKLDWDWLKIYLTQ